MSDVRHYFSSLKRTLLVAAAGFALSACSTVGSDLITTTATGPAPTPVAGKPTSMAQFVTTNATKILVSSDVTVAKTAVLHKPVIQPVSQLGYQPSSNPRSQWCRYLDNDAAARATILRAPTVSADINNDGRKSAGLSYDVMDIARARLIETTAEAKCRRYQANAALNRIVVIAPNDLTRAGYAAKAKLISRRSSSLQAIKTLVKRELRTGNLDRTQATTLTLAADKVLSDGAQAASEAAKRQGGAAYDMKNVSNLAAQLFKAERDLADINSNIRSADAVSVNLEGGWREGFIQNGLRVQKNSLFGGVKFSVKLGAFNPARTSYETAANRARINALRSEPGSIFWKVNELISAHQRARSGLVTSRNQLTSARVNAARLKATLPANDPAYLAHRYKTEIEIIKLDAEIAGINSSIRQLDLNLRKLRHLRV